MSAPQQKSKGAKLLGLVSRHATLRTKRPSPNATPAAPASALASRIKGFSGDELRRQQFSSVPNLTVPLNETPPPSESSGSISSSNGLLRKISGRGGEIKVFLSPFLRATEDNPNPTVRLQRRSTLLQAEIVVQVFTSVGGHDRTAPVTLSPFAKVSDSLEQVAEELKITDEEKASCPDGCGLFWVTDVEDYDGIWMMDDRTLWSYRIRDNAIVEYKPKTPERYITRVVIPGVEVVSTMNYDQFTTVGDALQELIKSHHLESKPDTPLKFYYTREGLWLSEAETLSSYMLSARDTIECKEFFPEDSSTKPRSVVLKIVIPEHETTRKLLVPLTTTVEEVINMLLRKVNLSDDKVSNYGLFLCPRLGRVGAWMEDYKFLSSFNLQGETTLEYKTKFRLFTIEVNLDKTSEMEMMLDDKATVEDVVELIVASHSLNNCDDYGVYQHNEERLNHRKRLWDCGSTTFAFHFVYKPVEVRLNEEVDSNHKFGVDFSAPVGIVLKAIVRHYGIRNPDHTSLYMVEDDGEMTELSRNKSLLEQLVTPNHLLVLKSGQDEKRMSYHNPLEGNPNVLTRSNSFVISEDDEDINIWDEPSDCPENIHFEEKGSKGERVVFSGTLNKLVERLTFQEVLEPSYLKTFLLTYQSFTTSKKLMTKLIERYNVVRDEKTPLKEFFVQQRVIQARVVNTMKQWMETCLDISSDPEVLDGLMKFVREILLLDHPRLAYQLRNAVEKARRGVYMLQRYNVDFGEDPPEPKLPKNMSTKLSLFDFDAEEIARQMTLIDFQIFAQIKPPELLNQAWSKPKYAHRSKNVLSLIGRMNDTGLWVATTILAQRDAKSRAKCYTHFVEITTFLLDLHNYSSVMAILGGLSNSAVLRLKNTKKELSKAMVKSSCIDFLRAAASQANAVALPITAAFWADKIVVLTSSSNSEGDAVASSSINDVLFLCEAYVRQGFETRAVNILENHPRAFESSRGRLLAARCYRAVDDLARVSELLDLADEEDDEDFEDFDMATPQRTAAASTAVDSSNDPYLQSSVNISSSMVTAARYVLRGRVCLAQENRQRASAAFQQAILADVRCAEAVEMLFRHHMLTEAGEQELLVNLPIETQCGAGLEADVVRFLYRTMSCKAGHGVQMSLPKAPLDALTSTAEVQLAEAELLFHACHFEEALVVEHQLLQRDPFNLAAVPIFFSTLYELKRSNEMFLEAHRLVKAFPDAATTWFAVGSYYLCIGSPSAARRFFLKATTLDKSFAPAWLGYGHSFSLEGEHDQATAAYCTAARLSQGSHIPLLCIAVEYVQSANFPLGAKYFEQALVLSPADPLVHHQYGVYHYTAKEYTLAFSSFATSIELTRSRTAKVHGTAPPAPLTPTPATLDTKTNADTDTLVPFAAALAALPSLLPDNCEPSLVNLGHCLRKHRHFRSALAVYSHALEIRPAAHFTLVAMGYTYLLSGQFDKAIVTLHRALSIDGDNAFASKLLSESLEMADRDVSWIDEV